jgi:hypothetical protein
MEGNLSIFNPESQTQNPAGAKKKKPQRFVPV